MGVILGDNLNGQKARLKLMVALSVSHDMATIREWLERDLYKPFWRNKGLMTLRSTWRSGGDIY